MRFDLTFWLSVLVGIVCMAGSILAYESGRLTLHEWHASMCFDLGLSHNFIPPVSLSSVSSEIDTLLIYLCKTESGSHFTVTNSSLLTL